MRKLILFLCLVAVAGAGYYFYDTRTAKLPSGQTNPTTFQETGGGDGAEFTFNLNAGDNTENLNAKGYATEKQADAAYLTEEQKRAQDQTFFEQVLPSKVESEEAANQFTVDSLQTQSKEQQAMSQIEVDKAAAKANTTKNLLRIGTVVAALLGLGFGLAWMIWAPGRSTEALARRFTDDRVITSGELTAHTQSTLDAMLGRTRQPVYSIKNVPEMLLAGKPVSPHAAQAFAVAKIADAIKGTADMGSVVDAISIYLQTALNAPQPADPNRQIVDSTVKD